MSVTWNILTLGLCAVAFFGLVIYRTWQDRREERAKAGEADLPGQTTLRKTA